MKQRTAPSSVKGLPRIGKRVDDCLGILLDEIQLAVTWSRPSILLAVHRSKPYQEKAIAFLEQRLAEYSTEVVHVNPGGNQPDILNIIMQKPNPKGVVFFVRGLGNQNEIYDGLNMHRETIVEKQFKLIFWLTVEECISLSHRAPDFWAFRHRVIEFPSGRSSQKFLLPSGVLLWHERNSFQELETIRKKIASQETIVQNLPHHDEAVTNHVNATGKLAYLYWLTGENHKAENLFQQELEIINQFHLNGMKSLLLNGQAISYYDRGAYQDALTLIEEALAKMPEDGVLWANHGIMCRAVGKSGRSLSSIKKAIRIEPASPDFWGVMGYMYMSLGKFDSALPTFENALRITPENIHFMFASAVCLSQMGHFDRFEETMKLIPVDMQGGNSYLTVCRDYLQGNTSVALSQLKEMIKTEKIPKVFLSRDPSLRYIFDIDILLGITELSTN